MCALLYFTGVTLNREVKMKAAVEILWRNHRIFWVWFLKQKKTPFEELINHLTKVEYGVDKWSHVLLG